MKITRKQLRKYLKLLKEQTETRLASQLGSDNFSTITYDSGAQLFNVTSIPLMTSLLDVINKSDVGGIGNITEDMAMISTLPTLKGGSYVNLNDTLETENSPAADIGDEGFGTTNQISNGVLTIPGNSWSVKSTSAASGGFDTTGRALLQLVAIVACKNDASVNINSNNNQYECLTKLVELIQKENLNTIKINFGLVYYKWRQGTDSIISIAPENESLPDRLKKPSLYNLKLGTVGARDLLLTDTVNLIQSTLKRTKRAPRHAGFRFDLYKLIANNVLIELAKHYQSNINSRRSAMAVTPIFEDEFEKIKGPQVSDDQPNTFYLNPDAVYDLLYSNMTPDQLIENVIGKKLETESGQRTSYTKIRNINAYFQSNLNQKIEEIVRAVCSDIFRRASESSKITKIDVPVLNLNKRSLFDLYHADAANNTWTINYQDMSGESAASALTGAEEYPHVFNITSPLNNTIQYRISTTRDKDNFILEGQKAIASSENAFSNVNSYRLDLNKTPSELNLNSMQPGVKINKILGITETDLKNQINDIEKQNQALQNYILTYDYTLDSSALLRDTPGTRQQIAAAIKQPLYLLNDSYLNLTEAKNLLDKMATTVNKFNEIQSININPTTNPQWFSLLGIYSKGYESLIEEYKKHLDNNQSQLAVQQSEIYLSPDQSLENLLKGYYKSIYRIVLAINDLLSSGTLDDLEKKNIIARSNLILNILKIKEISFSENPTISGDFIEGDPKIITSGDFTIIPESFFRSDDHNWFSNLIIENNIVDSIHDVTPIFLLLEILKLEIGIFSLASISNQKAEINQSKQKIEAVLKSKKLQNKNSNFGLENPSIENLNSQNSLNIDESKIYKNILKELMKYTIS